MVTNNDRSPRTKASFEKSEHNEGKKRKEKKKDPFHVSKPIAIYFTS